MSLMAQSFREKKKTKQQAWAAKKLPTMNISPSYKSDLNAVS